MGLFTLEGTIAIPLLQQMESLIVRGADEKKFDTQTGWKSLFGAGDFESSMEEQYGLNYPGEVLERYEERCGGGIEQERALGLALAENKMLLEESMFVGAQYPNFIRKIKNHTEQDFYLTCVMYLLSEKVEEQGKFYQKILQHDYKETKEAVFAAFVLQEHPKAWDFVKPLFIRFLGNGRTLRAYGNHGLYAWVLQMYADKIQKCRTKDMYVLKALLELCNKFVKEGTPAWEHLKNAGYSRQEIIYLNLILRGAVWSLETPDKKSITIERMALFGLKELINAKEIEDPGLLPFCESLLKDYESYDIHIDGAEGILSSLIGNVHIRDRQMYQYLYGIKKDRRLPEDWFYLDFSDKESCEVSKWMEQEQFTKLFSVSLYSQESVNIDLWFDNYQGYTGKRYEELFWKMPDFYVKDVFRLLVKQNKIDMVKLLEEYAEDEKHMPAETLKNKWSIMKGHIGSVARYLTSHEVYLFWEAFDRYYGICQLDGFFGYRNVVLDAVKVQSYGYRFQNMKFKEEILSVEEQAKLFDWVELMVYREMPQEYEKFLYNFLLMYGVRKSFPEDSVSLFHFIKEDVGESERNRLYREYFSTDEWEAFRKKENERREQIKKERRQEELQTFRKQICADIQSSQDMYGIQDAIARHLSRLYSEREKAEICLELLDSYLEKDCKVKKRTAGRLADHIVDLFAHGALEWKTVQEIINKMEVVADECGKD